MRRYVMDIEADGLLDTVSTIWMIVLKELSSDNMVVFSDHAESAKPISEFPEWVKENCDVLIAHNGIRYDLEVLYRLLGWEPECKVHDTMIMSKLCNFKRPQTSGRHSLKFWGQYLGEYKDEYDKGFDAYNEEMLEYCKQDCIVTEKVYMHLLSEVSQINESFKGTEKEGYFRIALQTEHELSKLSAQQTRDGWHFDFEGAQKLINEITEKMEVIENEVEPHLEDRIILVDAEERSPNYCKDGRYTAATARILSEFLGYAVCQEDALRATPPMQPRETFQRTQKVPGSLGNQDIVKDYLTGLGWKPDEWNWKQINGMWNKTTPKFTEKSLLAVQHPHAEAINEYYMLRQRKSILQGWMEQKDTDGRLRGDVNDMGAASFRQTHKVMVNIPGGRAPYGEEIRSLFKCPENKVIISADGAAYQIRILAHYLKSEEYTDVVLNGDPHQLHADKIGVARDKAKGVFFGVLFGAGARKVGIMLGTNQYDGKQKRDALLSGIPGMRSLMTRLKNFVGANGYVPGIDGRKVYPESDYKSLNYLIQSCEAALMKRTIVRIAKRLKEENIEFKQLLFYHDEISYEVDPRDVPRITEIISEEFKEAPSDYGVSIMEAGDIKIGGDYYSVH